MKFAMYVLVISAASLGPTFVTCVSNDTGITSIYCQSERDQGIPIYLKSDH